LSWPSPQASANSLPVTAMFLSLNALGSEGIGSPSVLSACRDPILNLGNLDRNGAFHPSVGRARRGSPGRGSPDRQRDPGGSPGPLPGDRRPLPEPGGRDRVALRVPPGGRGGRGERRVPEGLQEPRPIPGRSPLLDLALSSDREPPDRPV